MLQAGSFIRAEYAAFSREHAEVKGRHDLVSYVDRQAEDMLFNALKPLVHGAHFLMEESGGREDLSLPLWIIDPLDGTTNFIYGVPVFCVSVALYWQGQSVLGFVYDMMREEMFHAVRGGGAFLNGRTLQVSACPVLDDGLVATGFPFRDLDRLDEYMALLREMMCGTRGIRRLGSAALDLAYVAAGRFDAFFESNLRPWDVAAGALLVQEAGGQATDFDGGDQFLLGRNILASNGLLHPELRALIQRVRAGTRPA